MKKLLSGFRPAWLALVIVLVLLGFVSERSGYSIFAVQSFNWDIALMLTPWGMVNSFYIQPDHYLRPYYFEASQRGELVKDTPFLALVVATLALALIGLWLFRRSRRTP